MGQAMASGGDAGQQGTRSVLGACPQRLWQYTVVEAAHEYSGSIHLHTTASDGAATHEEVARIASLAGLDFLIVTDHNVLTPGIEGWNGDVLLLVGEEIHDTTRTPQANHYLALGIKEQIPGDGRSAQQVIDAVSAQGGFGFLAHPFERSPAFTGEPELPWVDWQVSGYAGLEIWNYMSEFKSYLHNLRRALFLIFWPQWAIKGPFPETMAKWDELLAHGRTVAIAGTDAHGNPHRLGPLRRAILPYEHCFRAVRTHILSPAPLEGDLEHQRALVYKALRSGNCFVAYDAIGDSKGFWFTARSGEVRVGMGEEIPLSGNVDFTISSPLRADLRLLRDGELVARGEGRTLNYSTAEPGVYRVEAYRRHLLKSRAWVFTNPIYVRP
jgi:hypothetical protein